MWVGMFTVLIGLLLVGLADILFPDDSQGPGTNTNGIIAGNMHLFLKDLTNNYLEKNSNSLETYYQDGFLLN